MKTFQKGVFVEGAQKASMTEKGEKLLGQEEIEALIEDGKSIGFDGEIDVEFVNGIPTIKANTLSAKGIFRLNYGNYHGFILVDNIYTTHYQLTYNYGSKLFYIADANGSEDIRLVNATEKTYATVDNVGTKLYYHDIYCETDEDIEGSISIISTDSSPINASNVDDKLIYGLPFSKIMHPLFSGGVDRVENNLIDRFVSLSNDYFRVNYWYAINGQFNETTQVIVKSSLADTVTPL